MEHKNKLFAMVDSTQEEIERFSKLIDTASDDIVRKCLEKERYACVERRNTLFDVLDVFDWFCDYRDHMMDKTEE